jgi:toxin FitB
MSRGILDTCVLIDLHVGTISTDALPDEQAITSLSLGELGFGVAVAPTDKDRLDRQARLTHYRELFRNSTIPYDADSAMLFGLVVGALLERGKQAIRRRTIDLQIASIAVHHQLALYTVNHVDFEGIAGLEVIPVARVAE